MSDAGNTLYSRGAESISPVGHDRLDLLPFRARLLAALGHCYGEEDVTDGVSAPGRAAHLDTELLSFVVRYDDRNGVVLNSEG